MSKRPGIDLIALMTEQAVPSAKRCNAFRPNRSASNRLPKRKMLKTSERKTERYAANVVQLSAGRWPPTSIGLIICRAAREKARKIEFSEIGILSFTRFGLRR